ncbi:Tat pathway signal sequence domain protein [Streptomyces sp. NBC_00289]|uniref:sortase-dependent protein n=1 Tax=Streptomyces sp. NBC_00289 TaxID=2975703 RepID=UPI0032509FF6
MRRTVLSVMALACTAVLAGTVPAFADGASPVPSTRPSGTVAPDSATPVPSAEPTRAATPGSGADPTTAASPAPSQVSVVPSTAPDTGVVPPSQHSGAQAGAIGGGAAAALAVGGAAVFVVRRRRATGE